MRIADFLLLSGLWQHPLAREAAPPPTPVRPGMTPHQLVLEAVYCIFLVLCLPSLNDPSFNGATLTRRTCRVSPLRSRGRTRACTSRSELTQLEFITGLLI